MNANNKTVRLRRGLMFNVRGEGRRHAEESKVIERGGGHRGIREEVREGPKKTAGSSTMHGIKKNEDDKRKNQQRKRRGDIQENETRKIAQYNPNSKRHEEIT
jgi:hypothetical protein